MILEELLIPAWQHDLFAEELRAEFPGNPTYAEMVELLNYTDGAVLPKLKVDVKGKRVYVAASPRSGDSTEIKRDQLYHMFKATGVAAKDNGAAEVIGVMSEHFHDRSHRQKEGEPIFARQIAKELRAAGFDKVLTLAVHSEDLYEFYAEAYGLCKKEDSRRVKRKEGRNVLYSLDPAPINAHALVDLVDQFNLTDRRIYVTRLDEGAIMWVNPHMKWLRNSNLDPSKIDYAEFEKHRRAHNDASKVEARLVSPIRSFKGSILWITDDKGDTFGSIYKALRALDKRGIKMPDYVVASLPHTLVYETAHKIIKNLDINIIASTSNPTRMTKPNVSGLPIFWYSPVPYFAEAIRECVRKDRTPGEVFTPENYPFHTARSLYTLVKKPARLARCTPDFSGDAFVGR